jgi:uncharacterized protein (TIGR03435 family)
MEGLASWLRPLVGRQVMDKTDLSRSYRFVPRYWRPDSGFPVASDQYPEVTTAIGEQLALRVSPGRAPVNILVVDRFEQPTDD